MILMGHRKAGSPILGHDKEPVDESGESLALSHDGESGTLLDSVSSGLRQNLGSTLALLTDAGRKGHPIHKLRLYDVRRRDLIPWATLELGRIYSANGEITSAAFSPDNLHLAIARDDNAVDIYDIRFFKKNARQLCVLGHEPSLGSCGEEGSTPYGITGLHWTEFHNFVPFQGLVTGGADGMLIQTCQITTDV
jgi:hypothetical protein